ncbi:MAG TPA: adenylate/guanylate cyclase domain-containing protein [Acidimicrobiia bacterium]|nr:adenylate/guanylate cyclase domain-containing protein [Acidimicrobiia bacterium]
MDKPQVASSDHWETLLTEGHRRMRMARVLYRHLPAPPRCKVCTNPFGGFGGKLCALIGSRPSRMNPNVCARCCEGLEPGGAEVDIGVVFADVRGSTAMGETMHASEFASVMNRFYAAATKVLLAHDALIDKLIGDEVMALFIPGIAGPDYRAKAARAAVDLARAAGYGTAEGAWLPLGVAAHAGTAFVGNVGSGGVVDFTALGDTVNTAARLQHHASVGEVVLSDDVFESVAPEYPHALERSITVKGRTAPVSIHVVAPRHA